MLTEAVINLVDIHDRLVTSLVYCAISHVVDFLYCLNLFVYGKYYFIKIKNQNMEEIQGGHCPCSKIQGGQPTTLPPPCRAPEVLMKNIGLQGKWTTPEIKMNRRVPTKHENDMTGRGNKTGRAMCRRKIILALLLGLIL